MALLETNEYENLSKIKSIDVKKKKNWEVVEVISAYDMGFDFMQKFDDSEANYSWYGESINIDFEEATGVFVCMSRRFYNNDSGWETWEDVKDELGSEQLDEFFDFDEIEFSDNTKDIFTIEQLVWTKEYVISIYFNIE